MNLYHVSKFSVYSLSLPLKNKYTFHNHFIHNNYCSGQFLSDYFPFWEILNLNLTSAVNLTLNVSIRTKMNIGIENRLLMP